jgi:hypothetical protein
MEYIAFIKFDKKKIHKNQLPAKSYTQICPMENIDNETLGINWLTINYGSIAEEIIMCDSFGKETIVK